MRKIFFYTVFILFCCLSVRAQVYNFKNYSLDEGLSQSQVYALTQDQQGFLWIATQGGGLNCFNGKTFRVYKKENGLNHNVVYSVLCDSKGNLWVGTYSGLNRFSGGKFEKFNGYEGVRDDGILELKEDSQGRIWVGTRQSGVIVYNGRQFEKYSINDGLGFSKVNSLFESRDGKMWVGSLEYGIAYHENGKVINVTEKFGLPSKTIYDITEDHGGNLLVFTDNGVFYLSGDEFKPYNTQLPPLDITQVIKDKQKNFWIAAAGKGLWRIGTNEKLTWFNEDNGLPTNYLLALFEDSGGNLWIGTDGSGISRFGGESFVHFNKYSGLPGNMVKDVMQDVLSNIWIGTENGLVCHNGKTFSYYTSESGHLCDNNVLAIYEDVAGNIWTSTSGGVSRFSDNKKECFGEAVPSVTFCFFQDKSRAMWLGTLKGVWKYDGTNFFPFHEEVFSGIPVYTIRQDVRGKIIICSARGYSVVNGDELMHYKIADEYGSKEVYDFYDDSRGNRWFLTNNSISVLRSDNSYDHIRTQEGLSSDNLYTMIYYDNALWVGSDNGIDKISLSEKGELTSVRHFGKGDGFTGIECNINAGLADEKGNLWFGTIKGLTRYTPTDAPVSKNPPQVVLTGIRLLYQPVDWRKNYPETGNYYLVPEKLRLRYNDNHLTFDFIAFDYKNPERIKYQFMLEGFDDGWSPESYENFATYSNLPPGKYTFRVRAGNGDGHWSDAISYSFSISSPFWKSNWFFLLLSSSIVVFVYGFIVVRTRRLRLAKRKLEEKVRIRTAELNEQKTELQKLSIVASRMHDGVLICDREGNIEWFNHAFYRLSGYNKEEFEKSQYGKCKTLVELSSRADMPFFLEKLKTHNEPIVYDSTHTSKTGTLVWTRGSLAPIYDQNGLQKIVAIYTDITDRKNAELALEQSNKDFLDSVRYARRIQEAIFPPVNKLNESFPESFILYKPRDIVSGDFYWFSKVNKMFVFAVSDCTGHGVPGAFMSMIGNEYLHQIVNNKNVSRAEQVLHLLDRQVMAALHQEGDNKEAKDGMDVAFCAIDTETMEAQFSGANIPLYLLRNNEITELEPLKESIGGYQYDEKRFFSHAIQLQKGDALYMCTDGLLDQFGGPLGKKFMKKNLKQLLVDIQPLPMKDQKSRIEQEFEKWKGELKQVDDILLIGIRI
ncbi:MAG: two-component regulator propeller domain-containing protein [Bacteroidota bacterium]